MKAVEKAVAAVVRPVGADLELLLFRHPLAGVQLPKGTVEPGETCTAAALRELHEESGLHLSVKPQPIGVWNRYIPHRPGKGRVAQKHIWHIFALEVNNPLPNHWHHRAEGSPAEDGLIFEFFWRPLGPRLHKEVQSLFAPSVKKILYHYHQEANLAGP